jgi:hypothetical protein
LCFHAQAAISRASTRPAKTSFLGRIQQRGAGLLSLVDEHLHVARNGLPLRGDSNWRPMGGLTLHWTVEGRQRRKLVEPLPFLDCRERRGREQVQDERQPAGACIASCAGPSLRGLTWRSS